MSQFRLSNWFVAAVLASSFFLGLSIAGATQRGPPAADEGVEVLTRGPVHEAFAETIAFDPEPGIITPKAPPAAIEESPPEQRPEGTNVVWMSGYWAWDDERKDFLWVSGIWRSLPPGRQWQPGYWARSGQGAQWTSGYWADAKQDEVEYLPEPPASVEAGPNVAATSADQQWLPGSWLWQQNRYAWRPGMWTTGQSNWDYVPAHYVWSPRGYVFVNGYYDHSLARRGVLFAPVYFRSALYQQSGYSYSPSMVISSSVFSNHLFLRPSYGHYYYGDYYGTNYAGAGYSPWFAFNSSRVGYDPFYAQQRWNNRLNGAWEQTIQTNYRNYQANENTRPPRNWTDYQARVASATPANRQNLLIAEPFSDYAKSKERAVKYQAFDKTERQQFSQRELAYRKLRDDRQKLESQATDLPNTNPNLPREPKATRVKLPPSPIRYAPVDQADNVNALPKSHEYPQFDPKVAEPMPRKPRVYPVSPPMGRPVDPKGNPNPNIGPKPTVEPKPDPNVRLKPIIDPKPNPKVGPKPMIEPKPNPNVGPKPMIDPKPNPNVGPKPNPNVGPKPNPGVGPKPDPNVGPKPDPSGGPKPGPGPKPKAPKK